MGLYDFSLAGVPVLRGFYTVFPRPVVRYTCVVISLARNHGDGLCNDSSVRCGDWLEMRSQDTSCKTHHGYLLGYFCIAKTKVLSFDYRLPPLRSRV
jgi:hypothetical protein